MALGAIGAPMERCVLPFHSRSVPSVSVVTRVLPSGRKATP